jgi:peptide/nickel transport system substrate-binding protein
VLQEIPSPDDRSLFLKRGAIDLAWGLDLAHATALKGASGVKLLSIPSIGQDMLGFVCTKDPFKDVRVRQALAYAIPYQQLVTNVLKGEAAVAKGVWPNRSVFFQSSVPYPYRTNIAKAKSLLAAAGHENGFTFTCQVSQADDDAKALAVPVQSALKQIGVTMNIALTNPATFSTNLFGGNAQAWIQSNIAFYVDDPYYLVNLFYWSKGVVNWTKYVNPAMDALNNKLSHAITPGTKKPLARQAQTIINRDVPAISLGETNFLVPMRDDIGGFLYEPDGLLTYKLLKRKG